MSTANRYFRALAAPYESARASADAACGFPSGEAETAFAPFALAVTDEQGHAYAALADPAAITAAAAQMEEVTREDYFAAMPADSQP